MGETENKEWIDSLGLRNKLLPNFVINEAKIPIYLLAGRYNLYQE